MARTTRNYETVGWQDGTVLQPAKVTVQGTEYEVTPQVESGTTPVNANNLRHMDNEIQRIVEEDIPSVLDVELIAVSDTAPSEFSTGDKYYNTEDKKIYTATSSAWENAETPEEGISYIVFETQTSYAWNGTDLISVGGGSGSSDIIIIGDESEATEDTKLLVDTSGTTDTLKYKDNNTFTELQIKAFPESYSTDEVKTNKTWVDGKPIYRKSFNGNFNDSQDILSNVDKIISVYGQAFVGDTYRVIPYYEIYNNASYIGTLKLRNNVVSTSLIQAGTTMTNTPCFFTIEYAKTID